MIMSKGDRRNDVSLVTSKVISASVGLAEEGSSASASFKTADDATMFKSNKVGVEKN